MMRGVERLGVSNSAFTVIEDDSITVTALKQVDLTWWNTLIAQSPDATIFQTAHWANHCEDCLQYGPLYLLATNADGRPVGACLVFKTAHEQQYIFEQPGSRLLIPMFRSLVPSFVWLSGPLCWVEEQEVAIAQALITAIDKLALQNSALFVKGGPLIVDKANLTDFLVNQGFEKKPWATLLVDLSPDEETLWKNLKHSAQKAIRKAKREGISVERIDTLDELYNYYSTFFVQVTRRIAGRVFTFKQWASWWKHLRPHNGFEVFAAKHDGKYICGLNVWIFNGHLVEFGSVQSAYSFEHKLYGNDLIKWEIIRWGHQQGYRVYDLAGVAPEPSTSKERGIRQFKEKWGGRYVPYLTYYKAYPGWRSRALEMSTRLGRWILSRRGRG